MNTNLPSQLPRSVWRALVAGWALLVGACVVRAAEVSDPAAMFRISLRGNSDTRVSLPLQRPSLLEAVVVYGTGSTLYLVYNIPTLPPEGAYALVLTGTLEGAVLPITSSSGTALTVNANGYNLAGVKNEGVAGIGHGDFVAVVPYWTLDTLFPAGRGVHASATAAQRKTEILLFDDTVTGIGHSASAVYFYFAGLGSVPAGWLRVGAGSTPQGGTRLPPYQNFIVRHLIVTDSDLLLPGAVQMAGYRLPIQTRTANRDQDNIVALPVPLPIALGAAELVTSGAFAASVDGVTRADELHVFDNSVVAQNKAASAVYYYVSGNAGITTGWYKVGAGTTSMNNVALAPGEGYILRKRATAAPARVVWSGIPPYLQ
jgi:uncharacterized protein (TIGR02597 family)